MLVRFINKKMKPMLNKVIFITQATLLAYVAACSEHRVGRLLQLLHPIREPFFAGTLIPFNYTTPV